MTIGTTGIMDGDDWYLSDTGIVNNFVPLEKRSVFDIGAMLDFPIPFKNLDEGWKILVGVTSHNVFAGVGLYF